MSQQDTKNNLMQRVRNVHFIGVGGVGMSGIAEVMLSLGFTISGSDIKTSLTVSRLQSLGIKVFIGHEEAHVQNVDVVVVSSAIDDTNPEIIAAKKQRIPIIRRAEMLAELMRFKKGIAVAGTHGKTTTTSLIASILSAAKYDPTYVIGGKLNSAATNAKLGKGEYLVAEADESDASFLHLQPILAIVTNIDADHLVTYDHDFNQLKKAFIEFLHHLPFYGLAILCADDKDIQSILPDINKPIKTYGVYSEADIKAVDIEYNSTRTDFTVVTKDQEPFSITLNLPGEHNILNALAAISLALELAVDINIIQKALADFQGIGRRFEIYGDYSVNNNSFTLVDDYGHHPKELEATIKAAVNAWPDKRLLVVFQPHRFTRTYDLFDDFCSVLADVDALLLTEVYAAGEKHNADADSRALAAGIRARGKVQPVFVEELDEVINALSTMIEDGDVVLTMGAGSIGQLPKMIVDSFTGDNHA